MTIVSIKFDLSREDVHAAFILVWTHPYKSMATGMTKGMLIKAPKETDAFLISIGLHCKIVLILTICVYSHQYSNFILTRARSFLF